MGQAVNAAMKKTKKNPGKTAGVFNSCGLAVD